MLSSSREGRGAGTRTGPRNESKDRHHMLMSEARADGAARAGKASPQAVFPAHPGEWGLVRTDSIPRGSQQEAMIDPSIVSSEHARHDRHPLAIGGQGGPAVLDDGRLVGGDLGLKGLVGGGERVLQVLVVSGDRVDLAGRDAGCREGGSLVGRGIAAGG